MPPYNAIESQKLFRQVEHGMFRSLPGGELIERLFTQLKIADDLIAAMDQDLKSSGRSRPELSPVYQETGRIIPNIDNPLGLGAPVNTVAAPARARMPPNIQIPGPASGIPASDGTSPFLGGARTEAPLPIPFNETPEGLETFMQTPPKRGRKPKAK
jgi:hypothetical protein